MRAPDAPFEEPWQAQVFGLTVALSEAGVFGWPAWTQALGARIAAGEAYWQAWVAALEGMLAAGGIAPPAEVSALARRWAAAAEATPHGQPIRLENAPEGV